MREIFISSWPGLQKNAPVTEDFRQFSEDFPTLTKMSGDFQTTFEHFRNYFLMFFPMAFELIVKKKKEIITINEMKFIS